MHYQVDKNDKFHIFRIPTKLEPTTKANFMNRTICNKNRRSLIDNDPVLNYGPHIARN